MKQISLIKKQSLSYGGELLKTRKGRAHGRPLDTKNTMHLILRSTKAKGAFSFKKPENEKAIRSILKKFSHKYFVSIESIGNTGNHLHLHIKLTKRQLYKAFIRAITAAIMMAVTGVSRWSKSKLDGKFWDYRPFTRVVIGFRAYLSLKDYVQVNDLEGVGIDRLNAYLMVARHKPRPRTC